MNNLKKMLMYNPLNFLTQKIEVKSAEQGSAGPYVLAWLLGVPLSLLILVAMFRAIF